MTDIPGKVITLDRLEAMFNNITDNTPWDMGGDMVWGYFFIHNEPALLETVAAKLAAQGYRVVKIFVAEKDKEAGIDKHRLHVERVETHTPQSLDKRNDELYLFAHEMGLDSYDGMHVGPVEQQNL